MAGPPGALPAGWRFVSKGDGLGHATLPGDGSIKRLAGILTDTDEGHVVLDHQKDAKG